MRVAAPAAVLALAGLLAGCGLLARGPAPDPPRGRPATGAQPFDLYENRESAEVALPIDSEDAAVAFVLKDPAVTAHLRQIDADYGGRRIRKPRWKARARAETGIPADAQLLPAERAAVAAQLANDGSVWWVELSTVVRESAIFYVCEVTVSRQGAELTTFDDPAKRCRFQR